MAKPIRCMLRIHKWGPVQGEKAGAKYRQCARCYKTKRFRLHSIGEHEFHNPYPGA
jgi:hypothetical protein